MSKLAPSVRLITIASLAAVAAGLAAPASSAQQRGVLEPVGQSHEVVQPLPPKGTSQLDDALKQLAADPKNPAALLQAGEATLALNDVDAAIGFYTRAQVVGATGGQASAGLAAAQVRKKKPVEALALFDQALREGASRTLHASDHGLAYDLVGDNARAQEFYRLALQQKADDETIRRLALSQAIGGDQAAADRTLLPLLQHRDLAAYRTRAFALAARGKVDEAVSIAETMMPGSLGSRIAPYLRYMPKLTRAQQAAAANFGHFPEANAIGHDDPRIAAYAASARSVAVADAPGDARLVPTGAPLGVAERPASRRTDNRRSQARPAELKPPQTKPVQAVAAASLPRTEAARPPANLAFQATAAARAGETATSAPPAGPPAGQPPRPSLSVAVESKPAASTQATQGAFDLGNAPRKTGAIEVGQVADRPPAASSPAFGASTRPSVSPTALAPVEPEPSLEEAFAEFEKVRPPAAPAPGAVDVTEIKPAREVVAKPEPPKQAKPLKPAKPAKPKNPSRIWVQVATGGDRKALGHDWGRITGKAKKEFKGKSGYLVDWGRTNRLVTGPFASEDKAQDYITDLKAAGLSTFMFTSDDGEEVTPLPGK